jgi:hypothetical protein
MTMHCDCARAEMLAGAIALGETDEAQRDSYRNHLATCAGCRNDLGGEREIERVMATARQARDSERWEPVLRPAHMRTPERRSTWRWAGGGVDRGISRNRQAYDRHGAGIPGERIFGTGGPRRRGAQYADGSAP